MTLVQKNRCSKMVYQLDQAGGQCLVVQVGPLAVLNLYAAHDHGREETLRRVFEYVQSLEEAPWALIGDFNDDPTTSSLALGLSACGYDLQTPPHGVSSRWESSRLIDYAFTNLATHQKRLEVRPERWSDHKAVVLRCETHREVSTNSKWELCPVNRYLPKDAARFADWCNLVQTRWEDRRHTVLNNLYSIGAKAQDVSPEAPQNQRQDLADEIWGELNKVLEQFLADCARGAQETGLEMRYHGKPQQQKGLPPKIRKVPQVLHRPYGPDADNQLRVWLRLWGRLSEVERQQAHGNPAADLAKTWRRIQRCSLYWPGMTAAEAARHVDQRIHMQQQQRLQTWRNRLKGDTREVSQATNLGRRPRSRRTKQEAGMDGMAASWLRSPRPFGRM